LLALADSDVEAGFVHVRQRLDRTTRTLDDPKNATSARYVPIGSLAQAIVDDQRAWLRSAALRPGWRGNPDRLLFVDDAGNALVGSTLTRWYSDTLGRQGIKHHRWHDLRHYYASNLLNRGVPIPVVSKLLGHRDATITTRVYHHILKPDTLASAAVAEQAFSAPDLHTHATA
jgi:integrase